MRRLLLSVLTVGALVGLMAAAEFAAPPEKPLLADGVWLGGVHPRLSPDGKTVAVSYLGAVWTVPRAGGVMTLLTHGAGFDIEPVWSPDGSRIAYVNSPRFGSGELQIVTTDGKNVPLKKRVEVLGTVTNSPSATREDAA